MKRGLTRTCVLLLALLAGGCIEFQEQTLSYRYDKAVDELRIFQNYRGIYGADAGGDPAVALSDEELGQMRSVLDGQRTFFFGNWIFEYNREGTKSMLADLDDPEKREGDKVTDADTPRLRRLFDLLLANVHVANGPFYLGGDGKLCATQSVSVAKCSEIVAALNACTPGFLESMKDMVDGEDDHTPAELEAIAAFGEGGAVMFELDGNALTVRWPMSQAKYEQTFGKGAAEPERLEVMRAAGLGIAWEDQVTTYTLGKKDDGITKLTLPVSDSVYTGNAVGPARALHLVRERFDPTEAARTFLLRKGAGD